MTKTNTTKQQLTKDLEKTIEKAKEELKDSEDYCYLHPRTENEDIVRYNSRNVETLEYILSLLSLIK